MDQPGAKPLMSARELADFLGVHQNYVYDQAVNGDLPSYKFGGVRRFRWKEVEEWLSRHRHGITHAAFILIIIGAFMWAASQALGAERVRAKSPRQTTDTAVTQTLL